MSTFGAKAGGAHNADAFELETGATPVLRDWALLQYVEVTSTNLIAAKLPAWHAVRADTQTAGRGRFQRSWVSDAGGLWLSAVVPVETNSPAWRILPLATGVAVCDALRECGVKELRLRWPNDVLVGDRKLAGLLIDQFQAGLAVVGIGINVNNHPEAREAALRDHVARLADLVSPTPSVDDLAHRVLTNLRDVWGELPANAWRQGSLVAVEGVHPCRPERTHEFSAMPESSEGQDARRSFPPGWKPGSTAGTDACRHSSLLQRVNALWDLPRRVQLDLDGTVVEGDFGGVDAGGRLRLRLAGDVNQFFEPQDVKLLRDIP